MIGEIYSIILSNAICSFDKLCEREFAGPSDPIHSLFDFFTANGITVKEIFIASSKKMERNIGERIFVFHNRRERFTRF